MSDVHNAGGQVPDYDLPDSVAAKTPQQMKVIAEPTRARILDLVLERAATVSELAVALDRPKSSVAYHVEALVKLGMLRVVRTRRVRAIEERFYGRTGRTIVIGDATMPKQTVRQNFLAQAVNEAVNKAMPEVDFRATLRHARIAEDQVEEFFARVVELAEDFTRLPRQGDTVFGFVGAVYPTEHPALPPPAEPIEQTAEPT